MNVSFQNGRYMREDGTVVQGFNPDGSINVRVLEGSGGGGALNVTLQEAATAAGNGTSFDVGFYKTLTIEVWGTSTSRTVVYEVQSISGAWYPIQGLRIQDYAMATQTTGTGEVWQFDVTGLAAFRARISAIAGGNVSVRGKAVI
ncbi:hypothetical protein PA598K_05788 [Paenibacillus sp. 598K]|uniref:hypothetical protein n=1 Tax=Paenibacillus sp. 598K TaxID=1117987 RepID=UPI000FF9B0AD|nr:hypothetical protein [Paenibacillus sp. 598K]GBF77252.1 hypothetical protein PA598K_05788 [Paenibacillus sp. 598K]